MTRHLTQKVCKGASIKKNLSQALCSFFSTKPISNSESLKASLMTLPCNLVFVCETVKPVVGGVPVWGAVSSGGGGQPVLQEMQQRLSSLSLSLSLFLSLSLSLSLALPLSLTI